MSLINSERFDVETSRDNAIAKRVTILSCIVAKVACLQMGTLIALLLIVTSPTVRDIQNAVPAINKAIDNLGSLNSSLEEIEGVVSGLSRYNGQFASLFSFVSNASFCIRSLGICPLWH